MPIQISRELADSLDFDLADAVSAYKAARAAHAHTVGEPAPVAHVLVERIVISGEGFEIVEPKKD